MEPHNEVSCQDSHSREVHHPAIIKPCALSNRTSNFLPSFLLFCSVSFSCLSPLSTSRTT
jgi:hypothetical protein